MVKNKLLFCDIFTLLNLRLDMLVIKLWMTWQKVLILWGND